MIDEAPNEDTCHKHTYRYVPQHKVAEFREKGWRLLSQLYERGGVMCYLMSKEDS